MKYIIICDPGIDDAIAIMMAYLNKLDIIGFCIVGGNVPLDKCEKNIKVIEDFMDSNIRIFKGNDAKYHANLAEHVHGKYGLGYGVYPESKRRTQLLKAADFLVLAAKRYKKNLSIISLGPLTDLAKAVQKSKDFASSINHLYIMGATYNPNATPYKEFNISVDPESAKIVYNADFKKITAITHENALVATISKDIIKKLRDSDFILSNFVYQISEKYLEFNLEANGIDGFSMPDPLTVCVAINPKCVKTMKCKVDISMEIHTYGDCIVTPGKGNVELVTDIDLKMFTKMFTDTFK